MKLQRLAMYQTTIFNHCWMCSGHLPPSFSNCCSPRLPLSQVPQPTCYWQLGNLTSSPPMQCKRLLSPRGSSPCCSAPSPPPPSSPAGSLHPELPGKVKNLHFYKFIVSFKIQSYQRTKTNFPFRINSHNAHLSLRRQTV